MNSAVVILSVVLALTAIRRIGNVQLPIWVIMSLGALAALATGAISPGAAWRAVDWDVMLFLFGVFVLGHALEASGLLFRLGYHAVRHAGSTGALLALFIAMVGGASALLMNDTLAIVGTPLALMLARQHGVDPKLLLFALAYGITTGSVASPIGNPQNLLIALHGELPAPFQTFARYLLAPTILNLALTYIVLRLAYAGEFHRLPLTHSLMEIQDLALARLAKAGLIIFVALLALYVAWNALFTPPSPLKLSHIALAAALPPLLFARRRAALLRGVDWHTLIFFAALFVLMRAVWDTGVIQSRVAAMDFDLAQPSVILGVSVIASQIVSNVPLVALYLPMLGSEQPAALMALAAGSTIAGNLFILGAASNVIVIQNAERRAGITLTFREFARLGVPLTLMQTLVFWGWFELSY